MNCEKYLLLIDDLIEGELDEQRAGQVNSHIHICPDCSAGYYALKQEKEIYAHYLFDAEPSADLWTKFQTKLKSETGTVPQTPESSAVDTGWTTKLYGFFRPYPALGLAAVLLIFGIALSHFNSHENFGNNEFTAKKDADAFQSQPPHTSEIRRDELNDAPSEVEIGKPALSAKNIKLNKRIDFSNRKTINETINKHAVVKSPKSDWKIASGSDKQKIPLNDQPNAEEQQQLQLSVLEKETDRQIEKTELLLRSFRNARLVEGGAIYDVGYEKQQARKLLDRNVRLRQIAENYGTLSTQEILGRVEPFLLDIANLENDSVPEKVLDIKERVKNQNIIASLQIYR